MALDITIIDNHDNPHRSIPVGTKTHATVFRLIDDGEFPFCVRMRNYYEDANYNSHEPPFLLEEIQKLKRLFFEEKRKPEYFQETMAFLDKFESICIEAINKNFSISAIAD